MMTAEAQERLKVKTKRIYDALDHKEPDRVPAKVGGDIFAVMDAGYTVKECIYDTTLEKAKDAAMKYVLKYDTDFAPMLITYAGEGQLMEKIDPYFMAWSGRAGYNVPDNSIQQFMERPPLHDEDIDQFFDNNGAWRLNKCQPNLCGLYEPMRKFNIPFSSRTPSALAMEFSKPEMRKMIQTCWEIADGYAELNEKKKKVMGEIAELGFPRIGGGKAAVPYDEWGDEFRGSLDCLTDLYENEDAVMRFIEANQEEMIYKIKHKFNPDGKNDGKTVNMTLHRGMDGFLSEEYYDKIYWKHLQEIIEAIMSVNMIPEVFCEGHYETRLDRLKDIPKGRIIYTFEYTPLDLAKSKLGDVATICGGIHAGDLLFKKPEEISDAVKRYIDIFAGGGGYIFRTSASLDFQPKANIEAMFDTLHTYGKK